MQAVETNEKLEKLAIQLERRTLDALKPLRPFAANLLQTTLTSVNLELQPSPSDNAARMDILDRLSYEVQQLEACRGARVEPFGSFESNLYTPWGDFDVSLLFPLHSSGAPLSKSKRIAALRSIQRALAQRGDVSYVRLLAEPRIPLLMFEYRRISCDVSVNNDNAVFKSHILRWITSIDPRCRDLVFLIKCWAKAQCINDSKRGTLNSYALSQLVVFHLQTRDPPILPPLSRFITSGILEQDREACVGRIRAYTKEHRSKNSSSVSSLFLSFFAQFSSVESLWSKGLAVCTFSGRWGDRTTTHKGWDSKGYAMVVEDPFDLTDNCARSVQEMELICKAFSLTFDALQKDATYFISSKVREVLFSWPPGQAMPRLRSSARDVAVPGLLQLRDYVNSAMSKLPKFEKREKRPKKVSNKGGRKDSSQATEDNGDKQETIELSTQVEDGSTRTEESAQVENGSTRTEESTQVEDATTRTAESAQVEDASTRTQEATQVEDASTRTAESAQVENASTRTQESTQVEDASTRTAESAHGSKMQARGQKNPSRCRMQVHGQKNPRMQVHRQKNPL